MNWSWLVAHLEVVFGGALALFAVLLLVQQRRSPQSTVAWLLFIFLVPYLALPLFLGFGIRKPHRTSRLSFTQPDGALPPQSDTDRLYRAFGMPAAQPGNVIKLLPDGTEAFAELRTLVESARERIDAQFYIIENDPVGREFVALLEARARAGIRVHLLIDRFGGLSRPRRALARLHRAGGEVYFSSPFLGLPGRGRLNLRNHRKCLIVDGHTVFAGGMNIGADYMSTGAATPPPKWIDLAFRLEGPTVQGYADILASDLETARARAERERATRHEPIRIPGHCAPTGTAVLQPVPSGPDILRDPLHDGLVCAIHRARRRVWIVTPYFLPTDQLGHALAVACQRGVDVRLLIPGKSNQKLADLARGAYLRNLHEVGGRVFRTAPSRMIHAKAGVIDDFGWTGSANFDIRSMYLNFETALIIHDAPHVAALADWITGQFVHSTEGLYDAGLTRRLAEGMFRLIAPVL